VDKKKIIYIALGSLGVLAIVIVALGIFAPKETEETPSGPAVTVDSTLTDGDKAEIKAATEQFVTKLGNYGWYPEAIRNPDNVKVDSIDSFFASQDHTSPEDAKVALRLLTNTNSFDSEVNEFADLVPFSVETAIDEAITVPNKPQAEGNQTVVTVTVPVSSTLSYISVSMSGNVNGVVIPSVKTIQLRKFVGELTLKFQHTSGSWYITSFENTLGTFATDEFYTLNGDLIIDVKPVSEESLVVN